MRSFFYSVIITTFCLLFSCKKGSLNYNSAASLIVTNAIIGGGNIRLNSNPQDITVTYSAKSFAIVPGENISFYAINDSIKPYYSAGQQTDPGGIYSVFLSGQLPTVDAVFIKENSIPYYTDSTIGIRLINLSPNSSPVNVTLAADTTKNIFFGIAYKQLTGIVKLPLKLVVPVGSLTFQVRDNVNNKILTTYTLPTSVSSLYPNISTTLSRNRNLTLVIKGLQGTIVAPNGFGVFPVANY